MGSKVRKSVDVPILPEGKTLSFCLSGCFYVLFAFFLLRPGSQDSFHLALLLFLQKGKLRLRTGRLEMCLGGNDDGEEGILNSEPKDLGSRLPPWAR